MHLPSGTAEELSAPDAAHCQGLVPHPQGLVQLNTDGTLSREVKVVYM